MTIVLFVCMDEDLVGLDHAVRVLANTDENNRRREKSHLERNREL
jgi:hypothetical protein